jgi:signal transduction histidine kinase
MLRLDLANASPAKHANAKTAEVVIEEREGRRLVTIRDDGEGFDGESTAAGQGLKNIRAHITSIGAKLALNTSPGAGTAIEVTLRLA